MKQNYPSCEPHYLRTVNISCGAKLPYRFNLQKLLSIEGITWEPELFPGVYYRYRTICLIYYATGSIIITGANNLDDIQIILNKFIELTLPLSV